MLAKPIGSHYDLRVRAIAVRLPLMPLGVEHGKEGKNQNSFKIVRLPLMPLGVEHGYGIFKPPLKTGAITFDAVRR